MTKQTITAIGDSQTTLYNAYNVPAWLIWAPQLARLIKREGYDVRARAFGNGGETAGQFLARADVISFYDTPFIVAINGGINDVATSVPTATTQANLQALIKAAKFGVKGSVNAVGNVATGGITVPDQTTLPKTAESGDRFVVLSDTSTTGGQAAYSTAHAATITGAVTGQTVWECRYPGQVGERGWGRIATAATSPTHATRIVVVGYGYQNWTTGGDTPSTPLAANATLRASQAAAVTAENVTISGRASVVFADVYASMKARILAGTDPDFSTVTYDGTKDWHAIQNNLHHNAYGHALVAQTTRAAFPAAWLTELATANAS